MQISRTQAALSSEAKADRKVSKMIFIMILFFLIAWTPYTAFSLYVTFGKNVTITPLAGTFPPFFAKLCTIHNPIIYFLLNKQVWTFFICGSYCEYSLTLYINNFLRNILSAWNINKLLKLYVFICKRYECGINTQICIISIGSRKKSSYYIFCFTPKNDIFTNYYYLSRF